MFRILSVVVVLGIVVGPVWGQDDKTYTIKIKKAAKGLVEQTEKTENTTEHMKVADNNGNALKDETKKKSFHYIYRQTVLEMKPGVEKPTKLKRQYEKAVVTEEGKTTKLPYEGKMVLIEKKDGRYTFRIEGDEELTGEDAKRLDEEFNKKKEISEKELERLVLPPGPVKVNETWKIDPKNLIKAFRLESMELNLEKSTATGKLTRAYRKTRRQFGVIALQVVLFPKGVNKDGMTIPLQPNSKIELGVTIDACIDGSSATGSMSFTGDFAIEMLLPSPNQPMFRLTVSAKGKGTSKSVEQ